ncbi:hypothetical protein P7C70_g38, partial [Phenoliferia sp. Uapishka_3]
MTITSANILCLHEDGSYADVSPPLEAASIPFPWYFDQSSQYHGSTSTSTWGSRATSEAPVSHGNISNGSEYSYPSARSVGIPSNYNSPLPSPNVETLYSTYPQYFEGPPPPAPVAQGLRPAYNFDPGLSALAALEAMYHPELPTPYENYQENYQEHGSASWGMEPVYYEETYPSDQGWLHGSF